MAFLGKVGKIFSKSSVSLIRSDLQPSKLSIFQSIRLMSSSKVFVGGNPEFPFFCSFLHLGGLSRLSLRSVALLCRPFLWY